MQFLKAICEVGFQQIRVPVDLLFRLPPSKWPPETISRSLQPYNMRVALGPVTTLRRLLTNVKDKYRPEDRQGAIYK